MKLGDMHILSDENISPKLVQFLRHQVLDIIDVKEQEWQGKTDRELLEIAYKEDRWVLTHDSDFGTLAIHEGMPFAGILFLRLGNSKAENVIQVCQKLLKQDLEYPRKGLVIVDENKVRIRQSPIES
jgi:predicted nuclease of predicted toxin-antitoxin system